MRSSRVKKNLSVLLPDGESTFAIPVLRCLSQSPEVRTHILSSDPWAPVRFSKYRTHFFGKREKGQEKLIPAIYNTVKQKDVDVILPIGEQAIRLLSIHGAALSHFAAIAPVPNTVAFDIAADKWLFAKWAKEHKIPHPPTFLCQPDTGFEQQLADLQFPVLIKPTRGGSGQGIKFFETPAALLRLFQERGCPKDFIIQSFTWGYDIDCSVLCHEGNVSAYTIQKGFIEPYHRFSSPAGIEFLYDQGVYEVVRRLVSTLNWSGIAHLDLRYDERDHQVKVIEMNPRFWGSLLGSLVAGVNFPRLACLAALRENFPSIEYQHKRFVSGKAATRLLTQGFLRPKRTGVDFNSTSLSFMLKDPLPEVVEFSRSLIRKLRVPLDIRGSRKLNAQAWVNSNAVQKNSPS